MTLLPLVKIEPTSYPAINAILGLERNAEEQMGERSTQLQHQVESLLSNAPPETLERILKMLREEKKGS